MLKQEDFKAAQARIAAHIQHTPVSYHAPARLHFKWESQQRTGSFKIRGAFNTVLQLTDSQLQAGLVAASSGNHGLAVAFAAQQAGATAHIFVAADAPPVKVAAIESRGARVERVPGLYQEVEERAQAVADQRGATYLCPYNDWEGITGSGTIALEWLEQTPELSRLLIPVGAGALLTGVALAARSLRPDLEIIGVQAAASPYLYQQFYEGHMRGVSQQPTLMEGLAGALKPGAITIDWLPQMCDAMFLITEDEAATAVAYAYRELGETVEATGAVGLAAVLAGKVSAADRPTGVLISGGNIDADKHRDLCTRF